MKAFTTIIAATITLLPAWASAQKSGKSNDSYTRNIQAWYNQRDKELAQLASPLSLVGSYSLKEGTTTFGSDPSNDIVLPKGIPAKAGSYLVKGDSIYLQLNDAGKIKVEGRTAISRSDIPKQDSLKYTSAPSSIVLQQDNVRWFVTVNSGKLVVRVLDNNSEAHRHFTKVDRYPIDLKWRIKGIFEPFAPQTTISITNVKGITNQRPAAGLVRFSYEGKEYALQALEQDDKLFFTFSDSTGEHGSYAFRFLSAARPDADNTVILDFNKATNPNCAFSKYSACPLPPPGNSLDFAIPAGEKKYGPAY